MVERDTLFSNKVGIALALTLLAFALLTRNFFLVLLVVGSLMIRLPIPRLQRVLYIAIYLSLATAGVLIYGAVRGALTQRFYLAAGGLGLFAIGGWAAYLYGKKHPEKNPDYRQ